MGASVLQSTPPYRSLSHPSVIAMSSPDADVLLEENALVDDLEMVHQTRQSE